MKQIESIALVATLFARLDEPNYARITSDALWCEILDAHSTANHQIPHKPTAMKLTTQTPSTTQISHHDSLTKPPSYPNYLRFTSRILTPGIPGGRAPVESFYVPWTELPGSEIGSNTGRYLSDKAFHITTLCDQLQVEIPVAFQAMPDHLTLLCELWDFLDQHASISDT